MRDRGTSFSQSYDYAAEPRVIDLAMDASTPSWSVDDPHVQIDNGVDFPVLFVVESNPATASVPSLTAASGRGLATLNGVNINAMV